MPVPAGLANDLFAHKAAGCTLINSARAFMPLAGLDRKPAVHFGLLGKGSSRFSNPAREGVYIGLAKWIPHNGKLRNVRCASIEEIS